MEPEGQEKEIEMQSEPIVIGGGAVNSVNGKTGDVVLTTSDLENNSDYQTGTEVDSAISTAVEAEATARENADSDLQEQIDGKQDTLTAGENITIENNVISAIGGGGVKTLTADDYNFHNPAYSSVDDGIALWLLDEGQYIIEPQTAYYLERWNKQSGSSIEMAVFVLKKPTTSGRGVFITAYGSPGNTRIYYSIDADGGNSSNYPLTISIVDGLTEGSTTSALSANQGRVLKNLIDSLVITGAGAPTTSTTGTVGQLYEDTTNGKLYQCTAVSGGTYTWEEVGAGGGGSITPVQTTGTSTTDVMSQDATTHMIYSEANPSTYEKGGAIYLGNLDANQVQQADPAAVNRGWKYFWALPNSNTSKPTNNSVCILGDIPYQNAGVAIGPTVAFGGCKVLGNYGVAIGPDAEAIQQSVAIGFAANASKDNTNNSGVIAIGSYAEAKADKTICIGGGGSSYGIRSSASTYSVALGYKATVGNSSNGYKNSVALGAYSEVTRQGEVNVGLVKGETTGGFNNTAYRVIGGVHDGVDAHDVVTVEQLNATIDAINTATGSSIPHVGA